MARYEDAATYTMKRRSFETYHSIAKVHFLPAFGTIRLKDLTREHVQRMYSRKRAAGLSAARVRRIHGVLSSVLNRVFGWGLIERNVREQASPSRVPAPEIRPLDRDEANRFLMAAEPARYHAPCVLGLTPGIRLGEIAACSGPTWTWTSACCACDGRSSPATA